MSDCLWVQESFVNQTEGYRFGDSDVYESFATTRSELFRYGLKEYGRCVSRIYVDSEDGTQAVGWVFQKTMTYEDCDKQYVREVWVTVHNGPPSKTVEYHYA